MQRVDLEHAIIALESLMNSDSPNESVFQEWFEDHGVIFELLGYQRVLAHPQLTEDGVILYTPDFLAQRLDGLWEIIEIKRPDTAVLRDTVRRRTFYADMNSYVSQTSLDYSKYFNDRSHRGEFKARYGVDVQESPDSILIAGRSDGLERQVVHGMLSGRVPRITHQTYDDILNRLEFHRSASFGKYEQLPGRSFHFMLVVEKPLTACETYIIDNGIRPDRNRITIKTDVNGNLVCEVLDRGGSLHCAMIHRGPQSFDYGQTIYFSLEVGGSPQCSTLVLELNGTCCSEARLTGLEIDQEEVECFVLGSDLSGVAHSAMRICEFVVCDKTLRFEDRARMLKYYFDKYLGNLLGIVGPPTGLEFIGHKFMYSNNHPNFQH